MGDVTDSQVGDGRSRHRLDEEFVVTDMAPIDTRLGQQPGPTTHDGPQTERPVPRWANLLAHVVPLLTLPSGLWRVGIALGYSMGTLDDNGQPFHVQGWEAVYILGISIFAEAVALTAFGLVRPWGEVTPRWIPFIGGRRVRPLAAVVPAVLGSLALILIWTYGFREAFFSFDGLPIPFTNHAWATLMIACYAPLNLWGPLLLVLTWAYYRRRRGAVWYPQSIRGSVRGRSMASTDGSAPARDSGQCTAELEAMP